MKINIFVKYMSLNYKEIWNKMGIENLEELIKKSKEKVKIREDEFEKKYPLTKEDILMFTNIFYKNKFEVILENLSLSDFAFKVKPLLLVDFNIRNEIINDVVKEKLILYLKFVKRWFLYMYLNDYKILNKSKKTEKLKEILEKWRIKKWDPITQFFIELRWYEKETFLNKLKNKFFWKTIYKIEPYWNKFFINDLLDEDFEDFIENLDYWVDFSFRLFDTKIFLAQILDYVEWFESNIEKWKQLNNLFEYIKEQIDNKENFPWDVVISIPLSDYMNNKNYYYHFLYELHFKEYITLKEIYLVEQNITFIIHRINNFNKDILNQFVPIWQRINFKWWKLILDNIEILKWKTKWTKIYELIDLIVKWIKKENNLKLNYEILKNIYLENENEYKYISDYINNKIKLKESKIFNYENKKNILKNYKIELLDDIFGLKYFNSSLIKEKKWLFILTKNDVFLDINAN